jgi:putative PIN family toxin of toxin-antitoxin system
MFKVTFDSNILVSALIKTNGKPAQIVARARDGECQVVLCAAIRQETRRVFHYKHIQRKFHLSETDIEEFLTALFELNELVDVQHVENLIPQDPPDNIVLACAVEGGAGYLVSGNLHLLDLKQHRGVKIVTPARFLEILNQKS